MHDEPAQTPAYTERLSFPIHQLGAQMARIVNPLFREFDVDLVSARVLVLALERGPLAAGEIVELLMLPQSTVSHQLGRMERLGYVTLARTDSDRRVVRVGLTERGRAVADACDRRSLDVYRAMIAPLDGDQIEACRTAMAAMLAALKRLG